jgi:hypothetical protein
MLASVQSFELLEFSRNALDQNKTVVIAIHHTTRNDSHWVGYCKLNASFLQSKDIEDAKSMKPTPHQNNCRGKHGNRCYPAETIQEKPIDAFAHHFPIISNQHDHD